MFHLVLFLFFFCFLSFIYLSFSGGDRFRVWRFFRQRSALGQTGLEIIFFLETSLFFSQTFGLTTMISFLGRHITLFVLGFSSRSKFSRFFLWSKDWFRFFSGVDGLNGLFLGQRSFFGGEDFFFLWFSFF